MLRKPYIRPPRVPLSPLEKAPNYAVNLHRVVSVELPKDKPHRSQKLRDSAKGEECLIRLPGCPGKSDMTIWSHYRGGNGGKGLSIKASDRAGAYGCTYCDAIYDGQRPRPAGMTKEAVDLAWHEAHIRSLVRLEQKGML